MRVTAVTGSASGIGAAVRARLERSGERVIGVDLRDAEVVADLAHASGRAGAIDAVAAACDGRLDGLVVCAGVGPQVEPTTTIAALDYFGAQEVLAGLLPALAAGERAAAVAVASNASTVGSAAPPLVDACLAGDEATALALAAELAGHQVYASAKQALARWTRRQAPSWAGRGVRLNAVCPGPVDTPLLRGGLAHPVYGPAIRGFPVPTGGIGAPEQVAAAIAFLLGPDAAFCCGAVLFVDGGGDAFLRPDAF